ncbi:MAG: hypothetical protein ACM32E_05185 [Gemmatimonadota bacterium]
MPPRGRLAWPAERERPAARPLDAPAGWRPDAPGRGPRRARPRSDRVTRALTWSAAAGIGGAALVMVAVALAGPSRSVVHLSPAQAGPLQSLQLHPSQMLVAVAVWSAVVAGGAGVAAALAAVARGARPSGRLLAGLGLALAAVLAVAPPAGSTDTLDYASYGRMVVIQHDPYVMTPRQLKLSGDPIGRIVPRPWQGVHSVYGPLATLEQAAAAELGGTSPGWILFWLKLWNLIAFGVVVLALDRLLRRDPARRARAHLLWSVNPLLLWVLVAGGHIDAFAAAFGFIGLLVLRPGGGLGGADGAGHSSAPLRWRPALYTLRNTPPRPHGGWGVRSRLAGLCERVIEAWEGAGQGPADPGMLRGFVAGGLIGAAADLKITFILFGLGAAWAARRSRRTLAALAGGALAVLVPSYLWFGPPAITVLLTHSSATADNLYRIFAEALGTARLPQLSMVALPVLGVTALLLLRRLPDGFPRLPAVRPAFALSLAWLLTWPYQRPWYDAMAFCLLALYPASRLDWPLIWRLVAGVLYSTPGMPGTLSIRPLGVIERELMVFVIPALRLAALAAVLVLCVTAAWYPHEQLRPRLAGLVPLR